MTRVWTFFYGSFMNLDVLKKVGLTPDHVDVARLAGFDIRIRPLANLVRSDRDSVYGILTTATHAELARLYDYARDGLGGTYLPEAVLAQALDGRFQPALCYIAPSLEDAAPSADYVERIAVPARAFGFPEWYVRRIEAFKP